MMQQPNFDEMEFDRDQMVPHQMYGSQYRASTGGAS